MMGWIKISRDITKMRGYFSERFSRPMCWIDLLLLAQWQDKTFYLRGNEVFVKRGQVAISIRDLVKRWNMSCNTVADRLSEMEEARMIEIKRSSLINTITIVNYEKYQCIDTKSDTQTDTQTRTKSDTQKNGVISQASTVCEHSKKESDTQTDTQTRTKSDTQTDTQTGKKDKKERECSPSHSLLKEKEIKKEREPEERTFALSLLRKANESNFDKSDPESPDWIKNFVSFFNSTLDGYNSIIPKLRSVEGKRRNHILARIREYGRDAVREAIVKAAQSDFLNGKNDRGWTASFSWLILPNNFPKVLEGNYDNKQKSKYENRQDSERDRREAQAAGIIAELEREEKCGR